MPPEEAFRAAIVAAPDDDTPRLVFADWLDEHGDAARAEFIRVQCELAKLEETDLLGKDKERTARYTVLYRREQELLATHHKAWLRPLSEIFAPLSVIGWHGTFRRGFVEEVACTSQDWLAKGDALLACYPIRLVRLTDLVFVTGALWGWEVTPRDVHSGGEFTCRRFPGVTFELPPAFWEA
jgi:uncharacterized protein (TIGR02996 family)